VRVQKHLFEILAPCPFEGPLVQKEVNSMRNYEVMYIQRPDIEEEKRKSNVDRFNAVITDRGGELTKVNEMGKRRLAYEIDKLREGYYVLVNLQANPDAVSELERIMKISDDVVRYLIIREDD
jgi:small subunit ribosomal protein S6